MLVLKLVVGLAVLVSSSMLLPITSQGAKLVIKQEGYLYQMPLTENVYTETFVISPVSKGDTAIEPAAKSASATHACITLFTNPIIVHFQISSTTIDPGERDTMLSTLRALEVPPNTPLAVTGFTCKKGPDQYNDWLSIERAKAVAELLTKEGFAVATIEGKGATNLVSKNYPPINRRVVIQVFAK